MNKRNMINNSLKTLIKLYAKKNGLCRKEVINQAFRKESFPEYIPELVTEANYVFSSHINGKDMDDIIRQALSRSVNRLKDHPIDDCHTIAEIVERCKSGTQVISEDDSNDYIRSIFEQMESMLGYLDKERKIIFTFQNMCEELILHWSDVKNEQITYEILSYFINIYKTTINWAECIEYLKELDVSAGQKEGFYWI